MKRPEASPSFSVPSAQYAQYSQTARYGQVVPYAAEGEGTATGQGLQRWLSALGRRRKATLASGSVLPQGEARDLVQRLREAGL